MSRISINLRLWLLVALTASGILVSSIAGLWQMRDQMINDRLAQLSNLMDTAVTVGRAAMKAAGTDPALQRKAMIDTMRAVRFGPEKETNYVFVFGYDGLYYSHINPAKVGTNGLQQADPVARATVADLIRIGSGPEGKGYYWYTTQKGADGPQVPKVSIVKNLPEIQAVGGIGVYLDDVNTVFWSRAELMGGIFLGLTAVAGLIGYLIQRSISRPLRDLAVGVAHLARGDMSVPVSGTTDNGELGDFARTLEVFRQNALQSSENLRREHAEDEQRSARGRRLEQLNTAFDSSVTRQLAKIEQSLSDFQSASQQLSVSAQAANNRISGVAAASEQSSANVRSAAAATEELTASVNAIGSQVLNSSQIANRAVAQARSTNQQIAGLADATSRIGEVVNLITNIASQTNLLALNATIEAARAGESGRGFAVVASEVKNLATQTGKATEEIAGQIASIQLETRNAVEAIQAIAATIEQIDSISSNVADSVEEQKLATQEIATNASVAAAGTREVTETMGDVADTARQTESTARHLSEAAQELQTEAHALRQSVQAFLADVKAA